MASTQDNTPRLAFEERVENGEHELVLVKNGQRYVFRCAVGQESDMLNKLGDMIRSQRASHTGDLDWFDAAVISHHLGRRLSDQVLRQTRKAS